MATNITSGVYATSVHTRTRDGKKYYWVYGWRLGRKVYRRSATDFDGSSKNPLETIGWCDYISEAAYNSLSPVMKEAFDASSHKVAKDGALIDIPMGEGYFMLGLKSDLVYDPVPPRICTEGAKRSPETCWDGSVIHKEICRGNAWVSTGETCPVKVCTEGAKRSPETCWNGSVIHKEICRGNAWVPSGETCPTKPECSPGDKKAGYVCKNGKWQAVPEPVIEPTAPEPVIEPTAPEPGVATDIVWGVITLEEAVTRHESGLPCYHSA